ncbi:MAG: glutaredoxin family protein [Planctomycetia bacterium]
MTGRDAELIDRIQARFGTALMVMASVFAVLIFCDRTGAAMPNMPAIWYSSRGVHLVVCGGLFLMAAILLQSPVPATQSELHGRPLFRSCRLFTRHDCHLCDRALEVLLHFQDALPTIEVIDIDDDPQLVRQFGESIPVVEIDGRVRFRGAVNPALLCRLIDAAELQSRRHCEDFSE